TLGIFFVLFVILLGFIIYWKRLSKKEESDIQIHSMSFCRPKVSVAVKMEDYEVYYKKQKADSNCGFAEEFEDLKPVGTDQPKTAALILENKPKNRYNNVLPYDSSRVKLSIIHGSPYDDYINANYMPGYNSRKEFIAAQGPLPGTVKDFWRMVWEKNVQTLVMLTRCNEQGRVKCEQYWDFGTKRFENINVTSVSDIPLEDWTIRDFDIKNVKTAETRSVRQFHFTAWPDHGVPETTELLISFRHLVREHMDQYSRHSPTVVHCSAGVGRTGTFIAIDRLIFQIERENIVDVYGIVHDLRMHRTLMVQTEDQYVFLNQCAMDIIRSRTGTNVDLIYQNTAALSIYENIEPHKVFVCTVGNNA
uniref:protein-tyrosine-phosphatase n=1 Tax=Tetraodon nigroviridis TaxID=99883 RepID=H3CYP2_TETNG